MKINQRQSWSSWLFSILIVGVFICVLYVLAVVDLIIPFLLMWLALAIAWGVKEIVVDPLLWKDDN